MQTKAQERGTEPITSSRPTTATGPEALFLARLWEESARPASPAARARTTEFDSEEGPYTVRYAYD